MGRAPDWLSHDDGVRTLIAALRQERGFPKIPDMSEQLLRYFKGTKRYRGESMQDFIMRKAEAYTRAQQAMARIQQDQGTSRRRSRATAASGTSQGALGGFFPCARSPGR